MDSRVIDAYRYVDYRGATNQSIGMGAPNTIFEDVQGSAVGWLQDEKRRFVFFKDEGNLLAQDLMTSKFSMNNEYLKKALALQKSTPPERLSKVENELTALEQDEHFPGYSYWTGSKCSTEIQNYQYFWGVHESGLIVSDKVGGEFFIGENHYHQFPLLILEDGSWIKRLYNTQNEAAVRAFIGMSKRNDEKEVQESLMVLEKSFLKKHPSFKSKFDFLEKSTFSKSWKTRIQEETQEGLLVCNMDAKLMILPNPEDNPKT